MPLARLIAIGSIWLQAALLWEDKPNGAKAHSSGKLKFPSSQTDAHSASASQAVLILRTAVKSYCVAVKSCFAAVKATRGCNSKHKQLRCNADADENEDQQSETAINQAKPINQP